MDAHQELLSVLSEILKLAPDFLLGQLIGVLTGHVDHPYSDQNVIVEIEDEELLPAAKQFLVVMQKRHEELMVAAQSVPQKASKHIEGQVFVFCGPERTVLSAQAGANAEAWVTNENYGWFRS